MGSSCAPAGLFVSNTVVDAASVESKPKSQLHGEACRGGTLKCVRGEERFPHEGKRCM